MPRGAFVLTSLVLVAGAGATARSAAQPFLLPAGAMEAAHACSVARGGFSLIIAQGGRIRLERYDNGGFRAARGPALSVTKNVAALACLVAERRGLLRLDEPAWITLPEWRDDARKRAITLRHLLTQTSGLREGSRILYERRIVDKNYAAIGLENVAAPGARFEYGPSHYEALSQVLARKLARQGESLRAFLEHKVLAPIAASSDTWRRDLAGHPYLSTGASFGAHDLLHLGELLLGRGAYRERVVVSREQINDALRPTRANPLYGLSFWLNLNAARRSTREIDVETVIEKEPPFRDWARCCLSRAAPPDLAAMIGSHGQRVYVVPSRDLIVVRQGRGERFRDTEFLQLLFGSAHPRGGR